MNPPGSGSVRSVEKTSLLFSVILSVVTLTFAAAPVCAQQTPGAIENPPPPPSSSGVIMMAPSQGPMTPIYLDYDLQEARERSRRARVALIATSAVFGVGIILAGIGASQCQVIDRINQSDEWLCNNAGDVLVPLGSSIAAAAAIGMITSGAMLGVRNRTKREIERDIRRRYYGQRLRWDVDSGRFVF